jgi:hypothetical protein
MRIEVDILATTPINVQEMLAPDLLPQEFKAICKCIYGTIILGIALSQQEENDISTAIYTSAQA